jgi:hypothetical protein
MMELAGLALLVIWQALHAYRDRVKLKLLDKEIELLKRRQDQWERGIYIR